MEILGIIVSLVLLVVAGLFVFLSLSKKTNNNILLLFAISFGLGNSIVAMQLLAYNLIKIPFSAFNFYLPWFIFLLPAFKLFKRKKVFAKISKNYNLLSLLLIFLLLVLLIFGLFQAIIKPVSAWDAVASWYLGGKAFFLDRTISPSYYKYVVYDYPPFMHLVLSYVNLFQLKFSDTFSLLLYYLFYPAMLIMFYFMIREYLGNLKSLLFTFLLAAVQNVVRHAAGFDIGNADLPLSYFMLLSVYFLLQYKKNSTSVFLLFSLLSFISCALIKNDGIPFALGGFFILMVYTLKRKHYTRVLLFPVMLLPFVYWRLFSAINSLPGTYLNLLSPHFDRLGTIIIYFIREAVNLQRWNFAWIFIVLSLLYMRRRLNTSVFYLILLQLISYAYVYIVTPIPVVSHILNSFDRLLLQILPISLYLSVSLVFSKNKNNIK